MCEHKCHNKSRAAKACTFGAQQHRTQGTDQNIFGADVTVHQGQPHLEAALELVGNLRVVVGEGQVVARFDQLQIDCVVAALRQ